MKRLLEFSLFLFFCNQTIFCDPNNNHFQASFSFNAPYQYQLKEKQNNATACV